MKKVEKVDLQRFIDKTRQLSVIIELDPSISQEPEVEIEPEVEPERVCKRKVRIVNPKLERPHQAPSFHNIV